MKIVIIGGVAAGAKAAAKSRRLLPDAEILIYTDDTHVSYSACGLPYYIEGNFEDYKKLIVRSPEEFALSNIGIHLMYEVIKIIPEEKKLIINKKLSNKQIEETYDKLIIATGASPIIPSIENIHLKNIFTLRKIEDGIAIRKKLRESKRAVIVGAGYIGIELLEAFVKNNVHTTIIDSNPTVMPALDSNMSELVQNFITERDSNMVEIINNDTVTSFIGNDSVQAVLTKSGKIIQTEMVVMCVGVKPNIKIAQDAGIKIGITGAIEVNKRMETNIPDIYACGDCAQEINIISNQPAWVPLGSTANKEGRCAAINACGGIDEFDGVLGSAVTRYFELTISMTGLSEKNAVNAGFEPISTTVTQADRAKYMPDVKNVTVKIIADKKTHKIIGAQAIGSGDADKRINTLTTGLTNGLKIDDLNSSDITYAPPFSTSIDPILKAAQILSAKLKNKTPD